MNFFSRLYNSQGLLDIYRLLAEQEELMCTHQYNDYPVEELKEEKCRSMLFLKLRYPFEGETLLRQHFNSEGQLTYEWTREPFLTAKYCRLVVDKGENPVRIHMYVSDTYRPVH